MRCMASNCQCIGRPRIAYEQAEGYGRLSGMASSKVWQVMWYGRHCGLAGSNVPYRDGRHHGRVGTQGLASSG